LHQQQQRLLYLRHASKCIHVDGRCPQGYPNCIGMKELWKHIASCREQRCKFPHCVSSR
jgi:E1A/CREB-binding protein